uniref:Acyl-coenzyme A oxidase n=1 Tax=Angiostrongylus cantonensis TaxID=6313 RepID=A0A0K0D374_ANGCA
MRRDLHPLSLHFVMFLPTIQSQGEDDQLDEWLSLVAARGIIGTYAQTELGHGTNLKNLETTATYDPKTEQFVLHSPTITSTKWWPGALGKSSNYAVVVAQLYTQGVCRGPHPFIVQIRDLETHKPLKGIRVGDIGPKFGFNSADNGFLLFDNYRIPRQNMLMRHSKVEKNGTFIAPKHSKLSYGTMVFVRSIMVKDQATFLAEAVCIAIRYSAIRRQGEIEPGAGEVQILDYQTQQFRLFPQLARAFAFMFAAEQVTEGNVDLLPEIHALSSGLKAVITWETAQGIEQCRLACGGHGYSLASAFPDIYTFAVAGCTYEGENIVLLLQMARFLMKAAEEVSGGKARLAAICDYLKKPNSLHSRFLSCSNYSDVDIIHDFEHIARKQVCK